MKATPITTYHDVMSCPACHATIKAKVEIDVNLGDAAVAQDGKSVEVDVKPAMRTFSISHYCQGADAFAEDAEAAGVAS